MKILINSFSVSWILGILKSICFFFDWCLYNIAALLFNLFYEIAKFPFYMKNTIIDNLFFRVNVLFGIIALFVIVKIIVESIVDPEGTEKVIGNGKKFLINVMLAIAMLAFYQPVFRLLSDFQKSIIDSNAIAKIVMLDIPELKNVKWSDNKIGKVFVNNVFLSFFRLKGNKIDKDFLKLVTLNPQFNDEMFQDINQPSINLETDYKKVRGGESLLLLWNYVNNSRINYIPVVTLIIGLYLCYYFWQIAISLGVRLFKMILLEMIAPIAIATFISPKMKTDIFDKYIKLVTTTYIDIFIRIAVVLFIYPIMVIATGIEFPGGIFTRIILILALLKLTKELPDIVSNIFGIDMSSLKGAGGFVKSVLGLGTGALTGTAIGVGTAKKSDLHGLTATAHTLVSGIKGGYKGMKAAKSGGILGYGKSIFDNFSSAYADADLVKKAGTYWQFLKGKMHGKSGLSTYLESERESYTDAMDKATSERTLADNNIKLGAQIKENIWENDTDPHHTTLQGESYLQLKLSEQLARNNGNAAGVNFFIEQQQDWIKQHGSKSFNVGIKKLKTTEARSLTDKELEILAEVNKFEQDTSRTPGKPKLIFTTQKPEESYTNFNNSVDDEYKALTKADNDYQDARVKEEILKHSDQYRASRFEPKEPKEK